MVRTSGGRCGPPVGLGRDHDAFGGFAGLEPAAAAPVVPSAAGAGSVVLDRR